MKETKQKKSMVKRLVKYGVAGLILAAVLLVATYFYLTSEGFLKHQLLPWLGEISGSEYSAETVDVSLWNSTIKMTGVRVGDRDKPFIVSDIQLSFSLMKIIQGDLKVDNLILDNVKVVLRQNSKGGWDIPFGNSEEEQAANKIRRHLQNEDSKTAIQTVDSAKIAPVVATNDSAKPFPVFLNVSNAVIKHGEFLLETADGSKLTITDASFKLPKMFNDKLCPFKLTGKLSIGAGDNMKVNAEAVTLNGAIRLRPNFMMRRLDLVLDLGEFSGAVNKIDLAGNKLKAVVKSYWDDDGIKIEQLSIKEDSRIEEITNIVGTGMIGFSPFSIDADVNFDPVDESLASLVLSFFRGNNPGQVKVKYHGKFYYSAGHIRSAGKFYCRRQGNALIEGKVYPLPEFSLNTVHDLKIDIKHSILQVDNFEASLLQNDREVVRLNIAPTSLGVDNVTTAPLAMALVIDKLDIGLLQLLFPDHVAVLPQAGQFSTELKLSGKSFKNLRLAGNIDLNDFNFIVGAKNYQNLNLHSVLDLNFTDFSKLKLNSWKTSLNRGSRQFAQLTADQSSFDLKKLQGQAAVKLSGINYSTLRQFPFAPNVMEALGKLAPFELKLSGSSNIDLKAQQIILKNVLLDVKHRSATEINLSLTDSALFSWNKKSSQGKKLKQLRLKISNMTPSVFNVFIKPSGIVFNDGWLNSDILFSVSNLADLLKIKGKIALYDVDLTVGKRSIRNLQIEKSFDAELDNYCQLDIRNISGKALILRRPLFEFEGNGRLEFQNGQGKMRVYFNCPNPQLIDFFVESNIKKLMLNGNVGFEFDDMFNSTRVNGAIKLGELLTDKINQPLSGRTAFKISSVAKLVQCENFSLDLFSSRTPVVKLTAQSSAKVVKGQMQENIELKSTIIDLKLLESLIVRETEQQVPEPRTAPYHFDLGERFYLFNADLQGITYGKQVQGRLKATIKGNNRRIKISPLQLIINERMLEVNGLLHSQPDGIKYHVIGKSQKISLSPLFESLISGKMKNSRATIDKLNFDLSGNGIAGNRLWDQMHGTLDLDASEISLPNTIRDTTLGNIMFLPLDGVAKFQKFMPINLLQSSLQSGYYKDMFKTVKDFKFDHGMIRARAANRLVYIDECNFIGPLIRKLQFKGWFGLGSEDRIKLDSSLDLLYLTLKLGIAGSRTNPRLELVKFIPQAIGSNVIKVLDPRNIPAIFKNAKDEWDKTIGRPRTDESQQQLNRSANQPEKTKIDRKIEKNINRSLNLLNKLLN